MTPSAAYVKISRSRIDRVAAPKHIFATQLQKGDEMVTKPVAIAFAGVFLAAGCATQTNQPMRAEAPAAPISKQAYDAAVTNAEAQYKINKDACDSRAGNAKDICLAEAKGKEKVAKADAEAAYKATPKAREDARVARAEATHDVAKEKCDDLSGNAKDVCIKEADAALVKVKSDAKVDRVAADTKEDVAMKETEARQKAAADKRDADYKVAVEKCDALTGPAKNTCVSEAKMRYGKS